MRCIEEFPDRCPKPLAGPFDVEKWRTFLKENLRGAWSATRNYGDEQSSEIAAVRLAREQLKLRSEENDMLKSEGKLLVAHDLETALGDALQTLNHRLHTLPQRTARFLVGLSEEAIRARLELEINDVLGDYNAQPMSIEQFIAEGCERAEEFPLSKWRLLVNNIIAAFCRFIGRAAVSRITKKARRDDGPDYDWAKDPLIDSNPVPPSSRRQQQTEQPKPDPSPENKRRLRKRKPVPAPGTAEIEGAIHAVPHKKPRRL